MTEIYEFVCDLVGACDYGTENLSPAMRERAEKIICGGDVLEKTIKNIRASIADIDDTLEMDFRNVVNCVKNCERRIKDGADTIDVYGECVNNLQEAIDEMRGKLGARFALENMLKMLEGKEDDK